MRRLLAAVVAALLVPRLAVGEPAVIRTFEAPARTEPRRSAAIAHVFAEGAEVSVDEAAQDGWRRVRLPDGSVGWIEESALTFPAAPPAPQAAPLDAPLPAPPPDLRARIYVKDLDHLAALVKEDPTVLPKAQRLAGRRRTAIGIAIAGYAVSAGAIAYGATRLGEGSPQPGAPSSHELSSGERAFVGGILGAIATTVVALLVAPKHDDVVDVVNAWNTAHPDAPFELERGVVGHAY